MSEKIFMRFFTGNNYVTGNFCRAQSPFCIDPTNSEVSPHQLCPALSSANTYRPPPGIKRKARVRRSRTGTLEPEHEYMFPVLTRLFFFRFKINNFIHNCGHFCEDYRIQSFLNAEENTGNVGKLELVHDKVQEF